jgi:hypothetical protein
VDQPAVVAQGSGIRLAAPGSMPRVFPLQVSRPQRRIVELRPRLLLSRFLKETRLIILFSVSDDTIGAGNVAASRPGSLAGRESARTSALGLAGPHTRHVRGPNAVIV